MFLLLKHFMTRGSPAFFLQVEYTDVDYGEIDRGQ